MRNEQGNPKARQPSHPELKTTQRSFAKRQPKELQIHLGQMVLPLPLFYAAQLQLQQTLKPYF